MEYVWPAVIVVAIGIVGTLLVAAGVRRAEAAARRAEQDRCFGQVARTVAQHAGRPEAEVLAELHAGRLPAEVRGVTLTYEREAHQLLPFTKTLRVEFAEAATASATVKSGAGWNELPADVRAEFTRSRGPVTRPLSLSPQGP